METIIQTTETLATWNQERNTAERTGFVLSKLALLNDVELDLAA